MKDYFCSTYYEWIALVLSEKKSIVSKDLVDKGVGYLLKN